MLLHLVQGIALEVEHDDSEATHDFSLAIHACRLRRLFSGNIHLSTDPIDLFVAEFELATVVTLARRIQTESLIAHIFFVLMRRDDTL